MDIDNLTIKDIKQIQGLLPSANSGTKKPSPFKVGENYLIRTVTMITVGKLEEVYDTELVLSSASWIADTGRFHDALKSGSLSEVEPFVDNIVVGRGAIIDATTWRHSLEMKQK